MRAKVRSGLDSIRESAERATGLHVSFDSISPSILNTVAISGLRAKAPNGSTILEAGRVLVYYDLAKAASGDLSGSLKGIRVEGASVSLDFDGDRDELERLAKLFGGGGSGSSGISFPISGRDVSLRIQSASLGKASVSARELEFSPQGGEAEISLSGDYVLDQRFLDVGTIRGPLSLSGSLAADLSRARAELGISARSRDLSLGTQRFEIRYEGGHVELRKVKDQAPLDLQADLDLSDRSVSAALRMEGFAPERSLRTSGKLAWLSPWLKSRYSGSASFELPKGEASRMSYAASVEGSVPEGLLPRSIEASIKASGDVQHVEVERARLRSGQDRLEYRGSFRFADLAPDGILDLALSLRDGALPVETSVQVYGHNGEYAALAESLTAAGATFRDLSLAAALRGDQVDFQASFLLPDSEEPAPELPPLRFSGEALPGSGGSPIIRCEGSAAIGRSPSMDLDISLDSIDFGPLRGFLEAALGSADIASPLSGLRLGGEVFISSDFKRLSWTAPDLAVVSRSMPGSYALLSLSGNLDSVIVRKASLASGGLEIQGQGRVGFARGDGIDFEAGFKLREIPYTIKGSYSRGDLAATGDYGLSISATIGETIAARVAARDLPIPLGQGASLLAGLDASLSYSSAEAWSLSLASLSMTPMGESLARIPRVTLSGDFRPKGGQVWDLVAEDKISKVSGSATVEYSIGESPAGRVRASLASAATAERYDLDLSYDGGALSGKIGLQASPLSRVGSLPITGSVDGSASVKGPLADPAIGFDATLRGGKYKDQAFSAKATGSYEAGLLSLSNATITYIGNRLSIAKASFSLKDASSSIAASYDGILGGESLRLAFSAEGSSLFKGEGGLEEHAREYAASGLVTGFRYGALASDKLPVSGSVDAAGARFKVGERGEFSGEYGRDGAFKLSSGAPFPLRFEAKGKIAGSAIDAEAKGIELDLPALGIFVSPNDLRFLAGVAYGSLEAHGLLADPEITGRLDAKGASVSVPGWIADPIGPFDLPVIASGRSVSAQASAVPIGKAKATFGAQAGIEHWGLSNFTAQARCLPGSVTRLDASILGIKVGGDASFDLRTEVRGDTVFLGGKLDLEKASVLVSPEVWANNAAAGGQAAKQSVFLAVDLDVGLNRGVQVIFPSKDFPVVSGYSDRSSALKIRYDQATSDLLLKGTVSLRGGEVFYVQRNFFLKNAKLAFNETAERFDPRVTLLAELRDRNDSGPVLITLRADNAPIASFQPTLSSDPTMTEAQIAALLGQNLLGMDSDSGLDIRKAAISGAEFIPQLNVTKAFEGRVREAMGFDIFYLKTQVLQRWLIDLSDQSQSASTTKANPLASYLDETSIYAGKYLGDSVFVHGSARLSENTDPLVASNDLRLNLELGAEFDTPFGLLQWTVTPDSPESLFIKDQSLSVSWKLSY